MTQQKAQKRIEEVELIINAIVKDIDFHKSCINVLNITVKNYQEEIKALNKKGNLFKELDKHLVKEKK
jgi:hypothetical protein